MGASWFVARDRLLPRRRVRPEEELAGHVAALLALGVVGLLVVATNPFALLFLLPSLHAWLWLPQVRARPLPARLGVLLVGFAGPALLHLVVRRPVRPRLRRSLVHRLAVHRRLRAGRCGRDRAGLARGSGAAHGADRRALHPVSERGGARAARADPHGDPAASSSRSADAGASPTSSGTPRAADSPTYAEPRRSQRTAAPAGSSPIPRGTCTSASAPAARTIMCDSWPETGSSTVSSRSTRDRARTSSSRASFCRSGDASRPGSKRGSGSAQPLQRAQRGLDEQLAADERRHRVPRQPEHERLAAHAERHRLPRLDRDAPEDLLDPELGLDPPHEVVRPDRDSARRHEDVRGQTALERLPERRLVVGDGRQHLCRGADGGERGREHDGVRLVHLTGSERLARTRELRPGRQHRDARQPAATNVRDAGGGKRAELRRAETHARLDHDDARSNVAAARTNVRTRRNTLRHVDAVVMLDNILDGDDGVRSVGHDAAGRDRHRLAGSERTRGRTAGGDLLHHGQRPRHVGGADGEAVHRGARERRQVDDRARRPRPSPARRARSIATVSAASARARASTFACASSNVSRSDTSTAAAARFPSAAASSSAPAAAAVVVAGGTVGVVVAGGGVVRVAGRRTAGGGRRRLRRRRPRRRPGGGRAVRAAVLVLAVPRRPHRLRQRAAGTERRAACRPRSPCRDARSTRGTSARTRRSRARSASGSRRSDSRSTRSPRAAACSRRTTRPRSCPSCPSCPRRCARTDARPSRCRSSMFCSSTCVTVDATQSGITRSRCGLPQPTSVSVLPFGSTTFVIAIGFE